MSSHNFYNVVIYDVPEFPYSFFECELMNSPRSTKERLYFCLISLFLNREIETEGNNGNYPDGLRGR